MLQCGTIITESLLDETVLDRYELITLLAIARIELVAMLTATIMIFLNRKKEKKSQFSCDWVGKGYKYVY